VKQVTEAARRILAKPKSRKKPLSGTQVKSIVQRLEKGSLADLQVAAMFALGFYGFLRWDDLSRITPKHLEFAPTHLLVHLEKRKNDQFRKGTQVLIARADRAPCPVAVVEKFLGKGRHKPGTSIWRRIQSTKYGQVLRSTPMTYSRASELFKKELVKEGLDAKDYGLHSLRSGGATTAAAVGIPDRLLQRQGGWRTAKAKNNYIDESKNNLLRITKTMQKA
jgi:integrase